MTLVCYCHKCRKACGPDIVHVLCIH